MKITSIKQLKSVIALCRAEGVVEIEIDGIKLKVGERPMPKSAKVVEKKEQTGQQFTDEDMLFWSSQDITSPLGPA